MVTALPIPLSIGLNNSFATLLSNTITYLSLSPSSNHLPYLTFSFFPSYDPSIANWFLSKYWSWLLEKLIMPIKPWDGFTSLTPFIPFMPFISDFVKGSKRLILASRLSGLNVMFILLALVSWEASKT